MGTFNGFPDQAHARGGPASVAKRRPFKHTKQEPEQMVIRLQERGATLVRAGQADGLLASGPRRRDWRHAKPHARS
ncbi:MAG: hypothetical protein WCK33_03115 [Phycisphaerae bacterium]|jgi:hypothetical protein